MMATNLLGPQVDIRELEQRIHTRSVISQAKAKNPNDSNNEKSHIERITLYKKGCFNIFFVN